MCMISVKEVSIDQIQAFKIFTICDENKLRSAWLGSYKNNLYYPPNKRIRVDDEGECFFAFANKGAAFSLARNIRKSWTDINGYRKHWTVVRGSIIVLPVTLFEVVKDGKFHVDSDDPQCLDGYYPAYESKEIIVHDTLENRNDFYDEIILRFFKTQSYSMSSIEKQAVKARIPIKGLFE